MRPRGTLIVATALSAVVALAAGVTPAAAAGRTIGQIIDDAAIATEVTAKLTADQLSNLTKINVKSESGVVTLSGTVDTPERRAKAAQIASGVNGVRGIVNNIQVSGAPPTASVPTGPGAPSAGGESAAIEATGTVAQVDAAAGTITLQDGRVLKTNEQTVVWQPSTVGALKPGAQVLVRGAAPAGFQRSGARDWRMGTIGRVDRAANQLVFTDGTVVRVTPSTDIHRGGEKLTLERLEPGAEVAVRTPSASAAPANTVDASEVSVLWTPPLASR
jgi:hyperosmotically inducible protein